MVTEHDKMASPEVDIAAFRDEVDSIQLVGDIIQHTCTHHPELIHEIVVDACMCTLQHKHGICELTIYFWVFAPVVAAEIVLVVGASQAEPPVIRRAVSALCGDASRRGDHDHATRTMSQ